MVATKYDKRLARERRERWTVEWCKSCPKDECGDCIIDAAEIVNEFFNSREEAVARMVEIEKNGLDFFGDTTMTHEQLQVDFVDEDTGKTVWHWWAEDRDVWRIDNGDVWQ